MKSLICHMGLGDAIILSGAAVVLAKRHDGLKFPCYRKYLKSVQSFFVNHPEVEVYAIQEPPLWAHWGVPPVELFDRLDPILCGFYTGQGQRSDMSFPEAFYEHLGVDYEQRWISCPIRDASKKVEPHPAPRTPVFVHDDPLRGFRIIRGIPAEVDRPGSLGSFVEDQSILAYSRMIESAEEVHVIDSAFLWLTESLLPTGELYLHRYARWFAGPWMDYKLRHKWEILS